MEMRHNEMQNHAGTEVFTFHSKAIKQKKIPEGGNLCVQMVPSEAK